MTRTFAGATGGPFTGCEMVTTRPAMLMAVDRARVPLFAAAATVTVPGPVPEPPLVTVAQNDGAVDVQAQPAAVETLNVTDPPPPGIVALVGVTVYEHPTDVCATVKGWPATVSTVDRELEVVFAATV